MRALPVYYIPHGAGPWPFMDLSSGVFGDHVLWEQLRQHLREIGKAQTPNAIIVITAHWETDIPTISAHPQPSMLFDYGGFPANTYQLSYSAPGSPALAADIAKHLHLAGIDNTLDQQRGFDHGTFVPLMLMYPEATIPVVQMSITNSLNPALHFDIGQALKPLREQGVLIIASGMSVHNMYGFRAANHTHIENAAKFDLWLEQTLTTNNANERKALLTKWQEAPGGIASHQPTYEHLTPLFVAAGAAGEDHAHKIFTAPLMQLQVSCYRFGELSH